MENREKQPQTKPQETIGFFCGKTPVELRFAEDGEPLAVLLKRYFLSRQGKNF